MHTRQIAQIFRQGKDARFILRPLLSALLSIGFVTPAFAAPDGGVVRVGSAQISNQGSTTRIEQSSKRAIIDWRGFSISKDELVQFIQPSASSATLNRVTGDQVSLILGRLDANGQVLLINPNGIIFGAGSQINIGSLIASTANLSNDNFMQGKLIFDQPGKPGAGVTNAGSITATEGGLVALVAPHVRNDGLIQAKLGKVMMGAADTFTIDLYGDGLINLALSDASLAQMHDTQGQPVKSLITQAGRIDAAGGQAILVTAEAAKSVLDNLINMSGTILANSAVQEGGRILLLAKGGNVDVSGTLSAQGTSGGQIEVLGDQVHLASTAQLDAGGTYGGGSLHVGGAYQGSGDTYRAQSTQIDAGATLNASATTQGNGGEVIVWSDGSTRYAGSIMARGGAQGGDGGTVEVSGKQTLAFNGYVDAGASYGKAGSLLLDPTNFNIGLAEAGLIDRVLRTGTSTAVSASGDINVNSAIDGRGRFADGGLTLSAGSNVNVNDFIITNNGAINLFATSGTVNVASGKVVYAGTAPITVRSGGTLTNAPYLTGGLLTLISTLGSVNINSGIDSAIGDLLIQAADDVNINQPVVSLNDGNSVNVVAGRDIKVNAQIDGRPALNSNPNGAVMATAGQNIDLNKSIVAHNIGLTATTGTINAPTMTAGTVTLDANGIPHGEGLFAGNGPIAVSAGGNLSSGIYVSTGPVSIRSTGGNVTVDTKLAEILGNVSITANTGTVNVNQEIANIRSGSNLQITAGTDINLNRQIDALDDSNPLSIVPVAGGSVTFTAGNNVNLNRDLATFNGPVDITATTGTLNIAWDSADSRTYRIQTGSAPISVTTGGSLSTGTPVPIALTFPPCGAPCIVSNPFPPPPTITSTDLLNQYIADQLKPWVAFSTTGKLSLTSTGGDVTVDAPIPNSTGEVKITAAQAIDVNQKLLSNNQPITLNAGNGGITVKSTDDRYGIGIENSPSIDSGSGALTLLSVGDVSINTTNGIDTAGKFTIDTRGQIVKGALTLNDSEHPSEIVLIADGGIVSFFAGNSPKISATSSNGAIHLSVDSPGQLTINAPSTTLGDVFTGGFLGANASINAGHDINLSNVSPSGALTLTAGHDANLNTFDVSSLDVTAGRDIIFSNADFSSAVSPQATVWLSGGDLTATSTAGNIFFNNYEAIHITGNASLTLDANKSVTLPILETLGPVSITAQTGDITLLHDIGPPIIQDAFPSTPDFDPTNIGVASLLLNAGGNIDMQGAKAAGAITITAGGTFTQAKSITAGSNQLNINTSNVTVTGATTNGAGALGMQNQLTRPPPPAPAIAPGPAVSQPGLPGALTALAAQSPNLANVSGSGVPGASGGSGSDSESATLHASGNSGNLEEIIPDSGDEDKTQTATEEESQNKGDTSTLVVDSDGVTMVFTGGRGASQVADFGRR